MPYTARIAYDFKNYFYIGPTETHSECIEEIVKLLNDPVTSYDGLNISIIKGHPLAWRGMDTHHLKSGDWRVEHFDITSWVNHRGQKL